MTKTQDDIVAWHLKNGGHKGRLAGHALRLLNEVVELCIAAGAQADEICAHVGEEVARQAVRGEFAWPVDVQRVRLELADVSLLLNVVAHHAGGVDVEYERAAKIEVLHARVWEVDADGVLWRPGHAPKR